MRTKLDIIPLSSALSSVDGSAHSVVQKQQTKMQGFNGAKRGARPPSFQSEERLRIRIPDHVPKAHPRFTPPATVRVNRSKLFLAE